MTLSEIFLSISERDFDRGEGNELGCFDHLSGRRISGEAECYQSPIERIVFRELSDMSELVNRRACVH
jgi:hypothetical protein